MGMRKKLPVIPEQIKYVASVVSAIVLLGGTIAGFSGFISQKIVDKIDQKIDPIVSDVSDIKLDTARLQLLYMIQNQPENESEILTVAKHYFTELGGDWYLTDIFNEYCMERNIHVDWEMPL